MNVDRNVVFMLKCVFRYSENKASSDTARRILLDKAQGSDAEADKARVGHHGGFMSLVCKGDFLEAFRLADMQNGAALKEGFLHLYNADTWLMESNLEPEDYAKVTHSDMLSDSAAAFYVRDLGYKK